MTTSKTRAVFRAKTGDGWHRFDFLFQWMRHWQCLNLKVEVKGYIYQCQAFEQADGKLNSSLLCTALVWRPLKKRKWNKFLNPNGPPQELKECSWEGGPIGNIVLNGPILVKNSSVSTLEIIKSSEIHPKLDLQKKSKSIVNRLQLIL